MKSTPTMLWHWSGGLFTQPLALTITHWEQDVQCAMTSLYMPCHHQWVTNNLYNFSPAKWPAIRPLWLSSNIMWWSCFGSSIPLTMVKNEDWQLVLFTALLSSGRDPSLKYLSVPYPSAALYQNHFSGRHTVEHYYSIIPVSQPH